jgi:hypothetical protein
MLDPFMLAALAPPAAFFAFACYLIYGTC